MYICRLPEDILLDIFQTVHDEIDSLGYPYHHTTAALARTCRLFKEPALNILWKKVSGLEPLISCFPEGVSIKTRGGFTLTRILSPGEWDTVGQYARRIRSLTISQLDDIDDRVMQVLISSPTPLLPDLRNLEWWEDRECFFPLLRTLLVPTIRSVKLGSTSHHPWAPSFTKSALLASLGARCPSIQELVCAYSGTGGSHEICEFVCNWQELFRLVTGVLDIRSLRHLASLRSLKSLQFKINGFDDAQPNSIPTFSSQLDEVSIMAPAPFLFNRCLRSVRFPSCRSAVLCVGQINESFYYDSREIPYGSLDIPDLIDSFSKSFSPILERISIDFAYLSRAEDGLADPNFVLGVAAVAPLLSFNRLTTLDINFFCTSTIDDATLKTMAQSWPQLEEFRFGSETRRLEPPSLTFIGLVHLIQHCRYLRNVEMALNAYPIDIGCEPFPSTMPNENITSIFVGISPIINPMAVACQLHMLLPNLTTVNAPRILSRLPRPFKNIKDEWRKVDESLVVLTECAKMKKKKGRLLHERSLLA